MHAIGREHERDEVVASCLTRREVEPLLLFLVGCQDLGRVLGLVGGTVSVDNPDVEHCCVASLPESADAHVTTEFLRNLSVTIGINLGVLTLMDDRFVRDSPRGECLVTEAMPLSNHIVVAQED